jgi:adenine deaminase
MRTAIRAVADTAGGLAVAEGNRVVAKLPLPLAGLMTDRPPHEAAGALTRLLEAAHALGSPLRDPFMTLSFLALEVMPSLKLTDRGLVDVPVMEHVPLFVE